MKHSTTPPIDVAYVHDICQMIKEQIGHVVVGYESVIDNLLICLITKGHMYMIGVPGIAKTTLAKSFAMVTGLTWNRVQFTQDVLPADIIGHYYFDQKENIFKLRKGPIFGELILADEINRASPKTQSALIEAMQERQVTIEGTTLLLPDPFFVIATKNPIETEGVYQLPEAQLDRFLFSISMDYLPRKQEEEMLRNKNRISQDMFYRLKPISDIKSIIGLHHHVYADTSIIQYIMNIIEETRTQPQLLMGASPRAAEHLLYASKASALIHGKDYVIPDDVKKVASNVLSHRLILSTEADLEGTSTKKIIDDILTTVEIPDFVEVPTIHR
ncbi:MAG: MoxR family ATPase [Thermoplasmatota archaeon]